jgi:hypothetical protein
MSKVNIRVWTNCKNLQGQTTVMSDLWQGQLTKGLLQVLGERGWIVKVGNLEKYTMDPATHDNL